MRIRMMNLFGSKCQQYVSRRVGERYKKIMLNVIVKHCKGSVLFWGCISTCRVGDIFELIVNECWQGLIHQSLLQESIWFWMVLFFSSDQLRSQACSYLKRQTAHKSLTMMDWNNIPKTRSQKTSERLKQCQGRSFLRMVTKTCSNNKDWPRL